MIFKIPESYSSLPAADLRRSAETNEIEDRQNHWDWKSEAFYRLEIKNIDEVNVSVLLFLPFGPLISTRTGTAK